MPQTDVVKGVLFRSYRDGAQFTLTAESSIAAQKDLGADIIIAFDELPPYHIAKDSLKNALERTHRWQERSLKAHLANPQGQALYAVIHGGVDIAKREQSCAFLTPLCFDGFAIGGSMGKSKQEMFAMLSATMPRLPIDKPNHLLGIGDLESLHLTIPLGIDTFDSSYPTRAARHGILLTQNGPLNITKRAYSTALRPIEEECQCPTCKHFTLAYLHHLFKANELTAFSLATAHNLHFMVQFMQIYRQKILNDEV